MNHIGPYYGFYAKRRRPDETPASVRAEMIAAQNREAPTIQSSERKQALYRKMLARQQRRGAQS